MSQYEPYRPEVTITIPLLRSVGIMKDEFYPKTGQIIRKCGYIESYDREVITTPYISSTGELGTGATVTYELEAPTTEQYDPVQLRTYPRTTIIATDNDTPAELETTATVKIED